jgi:NADPH-dependent glutamate synthase beta subunit-like oxidoreductase
MTQIMEERGLKIRYVDPQELRQRYDAVLLTTGATQPRDLLIPGRTLRGIHFAMDFLVRSTKSLLDSQLTDGQYISTKDQDVIVIGGGDTGADCVGTALRQDCRSVINFELLDRPSAARGPSNPWPQWPRVFRLDYSHEECQARFGDDPRVYATLTKEFVDDGQGHVAGVKTVRIDWSKRTDQTPFRVIPGTERVWKADRIFLSLGFSGPESEITEMLGVQHDARGNYGAELGSFATNVPGVFAAGDCRRGQSLVVWAISEGRGAARAVDEYLMGFSTLPAPSATTGSAHRM